MTAALRAALLWVERLIEAAEQRPDSVAAQQLAEFTGGGRVWLEARR